jgi:hypothetical protein
LNDLFFFELQTRRWRALCENIRGTFPIARWSHGFASTDGNLFVFGGASDSGNLLNLKAYISNYGVWLRGEERDTGTHLFCVDLGVADIMVVRKSSGVKVERGRDH